MAKRCTNCGNFLMDDERFCSRCGENVGEDPSDNVTHFSTENTAAQNSANTGSSNPYGSSNPRSQNYVPPNAYSNYPNPVNKTEMTLGQWVGTVVVTTMLGIISIIFLFIWGFGDGPESRKNYCKAMLIVMAIGLVVGLLFAFAVSGIIMSNFRDLVYYYN